MHAIWLLPTITAGFILGAIAEKSAAPIPVQQPPDAAAPVAACDPPDITDLFARLRPIAQVGKYHFDSGVVVEFYQDGVEVTLKTNGNNAFHSDEYHAIGSDLKNAVEHLLGAGDKIKTALDGWGKN